jgi:hypothetical protein
VANQIALQHAYIVGNHFWLATEAEILSRNHKVKIYFILTNRTYSHVLQIYRVKRRKGLQHHRKLKECQQWHMPKKPGIVPKQQQLQQMAHNNIH